jgi:DNA-directed RNA polymerase specialized sigma24 family protein
VKRCPADEQIEARRLLAAIEREASWRAVQALVLLAFGENIADVARMLGREPSSIYSAAQRARQHLAEQHGREPKQPTPPTPKRRKRKR